MCIRETFLNDFDSISKRFSENISIYYALDRKDSMGISYFELNRVSNELGLYFSKLFGENPQYVGVSLSDYFLLPLVILGIWKSKNCFSGIGTQYTRKNNLDFLNFLRVKYLITDSATCEFGDKLISQFFVHERQFFIWCREAENEISHLEDVCYGIMTSASTGEPKIIQVPWSCILPNAVELSIKFQVTELDCIFLASPYSFDPFFIELLIAFLTGSALMIVSNAVKLCPPDLLATLFQNTRYTNSVSSCLNCGNTKTENYFLPKIQKGNKKTVSILQMTPSIFRRWTDGEIEDFILSLTTPLRILILGGEKFPKEVLKLKHPQNTTRIFNIYGITEISCWAFLNEVTLERNSPEISIGRPLNDITYKISESGEFEIGSSKRICLVNGEATFQQVNPVYRDTGDIVQVSKGEIYFTGRTSQMVKKYGMKINLSKIEEAFMNENRLMKQCFCFYDNESLKLALFYVPVVVMPKKINFKHITVGEFYKNNYKIPIDAIKSIEKPDYLIEVTETPLNSHGKYDKQQFLKYLRGICKTEQHAPDLKNTFRKLWVELLGVVDSSFSSTTTFIELGGNSVLALELINKLEDLGYNVPQNFVSELLGGKSYDNCFKCLSLAQDKFEIPRKRIKSDSVTGQVGLSVVWKFDLGKCVDAPVTIFSYEGEERLVIGSHSSKLSCINSDSGCEIWSTFLGDRIESGFTPTKDGSRGFIGCYDHCVYCIANSNGSVIWKFQTGDVVKSTPCLSTDENTLYVASYDKNLYCLSAMDGTPQKSLKLSDRGMRCPGIVSHSFNSFFIGTLDGICLAVNQETNEPTWKTTVETPVFAAPCLVPNKPEILFSEVLGNVHCLNILNGQKMWTFKADGNIYSSPTVEDINGTYHIFFGCHDAHLYCLHYEKEPKLKWKQQLDSFVFAKPLVVLDFSSVCAATTKGFIYLCDIAVGSVQVRFKLPGEVFSSAVYSKNRLFVGCRDNNVYSLEITTNKPP